MIESPTVNVQECIQMQLILPALAAHDTGRREQQQRTGDQQQQTEASKYTDNLKLVTFPNNYLTTRGLQYEGGYCPRVY